MHSHIIKHIFNYTNKMHNIASLYIFTVHLPHVLVLHHISENCVSFTLNHMILCGCCLWFLQWLRQKYSYKRYSLHLQKAIIYTVVDHRCCSTVLYVKTLKIYEKKSSVYYSHALTYVRVAFHGTLRKLNFTEVGISLNSM